MKVCLEAEITSGSRPQLLLRFIHFSFETGSLPEPGAGYFGYMLHSGVLFVSASRPQDYRVSYVGDGDSNSGPHTCKTKLSPQGTISPVLIFFCLARRQRVSGDLIDGVQEWVMHMCLHSCSSPCIYIVLFS